MIGPACDICGEWDTGDYVQFEVIKPSEIEHNRLYDYYSQIDEPIEGDRFGNRYFCKNHLEIARKYSHLPYYEEAYSLIKKDVQS